MPYDFRRFLDQLREKGELCEIPRQVDPKYQAATLMKQMDDREGPALLFTNVKDYSIPIVANTLCTLERTALALDCKRSEIRDKVTYMMNNRIPPKIVNSGPIQEVVITEAGQIDLMKLFPILTQAPRDGGPYITSGIVLTKNPETGRRNLSYNRMMVTGPRKTGMAMNIWRHIREFYEKAEAKDQPLECSVNIGVDPAIEIATGVKTPYDELELVGGLHGEPVELVKGATIEVEAIADAEIVIEGRIPPHVLEPEGPMGEYTGCFGARRNRPIFEATGVMTRKSPYYRALRGGSTEHLILGNVVAREPSLYSMVRRLVSTVQDVHITPYTGGFMAAIQMEKQYEGDVQNVMMAAFASHINIKFSW